MKKRREPSVAGLFYPADPVELQHIVREYLGGGIDEGLMPKIIIAPHAGYIYSGTVAGKAYHTLLPHRDVVTKVVVIGPAHQIGDRGIFLSEADTFVTPLGEIKVDSELRDKLVGSGIARVLEAAHDGEHSVEVHLPFLQTVLKDFTILPITVGDCSDDEVAELINVVWGERDTVIVISSDLSHYLSYSEAVIMDAATSDSILNLRPEAIHSFNACGSVPIRGALKVAKKQGLTPKLIQLCNSGDTSGSKHRVVGYGAYVLQ